ncbi:transglutaminase TgpA family protein [Streptomyces albus]|uniref:Transglutaminase n=1 Tax=Streptomyces albus TaxID=1888 RepID=A0A8H1LQE0_9ACTN|nr:DUF3488 and transglutaminase-like domain-containing protein [Streptomyces albus]TGG89553.1 transglutaminase [Streptomyces albus]UVN57259.1 DUF3488 and transglutaminase-like domain-containing protein [Streptomyces albus]
MSGRARLAVCAALATLAAACALLPLVDPATWLLQAAMLVGIQAGVGAAARRVPLPGAVTVAAQAVVSLLLLTLVFARQYAPGGFVPVPRVFVRFGELLRQGADDVSQYAIPAPVTDGIRLMLVGGVLVIALLVDMLAVTFRSAAPAGLPLLALYSVAAGLSESGARWLWFLCAAGGYLLLLLAEGRERLSQWGRVFTDRSRPGSAPYQPGSVRGAATVPVRTGRRIGVLALGLSLLVPAALPSLGGGLLEAARDSGGQGGKGGGTISAVNPLVALQDSLNQPENRTALVYSTDSEETQDLYMRIVALDKFDGSAWKPSERRIGEVPDPMPTPRGLAPGVRTDKVRSTVKAGEWYAQDWLPMPYPANRVRIEGKWRFEPEGRTLVGYDGQTTRGVRYDVESIQVRPTAEQLRNAPEPPAALRREYTAVPDSLPDVVRETARRVTRGAEDDYDRAVLLQDWFAVKGGFSYDTQVQAGSGTAAITKFLQEKEGFCIHFSFAMASMARTLGIPARVAVGFTPGTARGDGKMEIGLQDAHAWPELYFEGVGWTRFEPTPTRGTTPSYAQPNTPDSDGDTGEQLPDRGQADRPAPSPSDDDRCTAQEKRSDPECGLANPLPGSGGSEKGFPLPAAVGIAAGALVLLLLLVLPMLLRLRSRARRLRPAARPARGASAAGEKPPPGRTFPADGSPAGTHDDEIAAATAQVRDAWQEMIDTAWDYGVVPQEAATPRNAAARIARIGELGPEETAAAHRVALAVEQVLYAPVPRATPGLADEVRRVHAGLRAAAPRRVRLRALLLPPSTARLRWAAAGRLRAVRSRLTPRFAK